MELKRLKTYWVYILCSKRNGTPYVGVTGNLVRRIYEHRNGLVPGFTKLYNTSKLVHAEAFRDVRDAIYREKCIKKWNRAWKINLIEQNNPEWRDLYETL
jgi:putative endonuclease